MLVLAGCSTSSAAEDRAQAARSALASLPELPQVDGSYYARYPAAARNGWTAPGFFPVGTWFSSLQGKDDVAADRALGLNTYFHLTDNSDLSLLPGSGFTAILGSPFQRRSGQLVGNLLGDEVDMRGGPGTAAVSAGGADAPQPCAQSDQKCGYSALAAAKRQAARSSGVLDWANFGKGVAFWETDQEAAAFVNRYTDIVSTDVYWYTDPNVCDEAAAAAMAVPKDKCRRAGNYGRLIDRERRLDQADGRSQPIMAFVETGTPGDGWATITPDQMAGAVMSSVIHGARGVVYFDHNFGGACRSEHGLRDCDPAMRDAVRRVDQQLKDLAPALNAPARAVNLGPGLDSTIRAADGAVYVIAMIDPSTDPGTRTFTLPASLRGWTISAPYEDRAIARTATDTFTDRFDDEAAYHVYRITP